MIEGSSDILPRMTVPVTVNGQGPFQFVVDTGANRSSVSENLAARLALPAGPTVSVKSATSTDNTPSAKLAQLAVGLRQITDVTAPVLTRANIGAEGILGIDAVADQAVLMDFDKNIMTVGPSTWGNSDPSNTVIVRGRSRYGQLVMVDCLVEGVTVYVVVDTGGEVSIGNTALRESIRRRRLEKAQTVDITGVTGKTAEADLGMIPLVKVGGVGVTNMQVAYADLSIFKEFGLDKRPAMLLGMDVLRHFRRVSIDFKSRQVRFLLADNHGTFLPD